MIESIEIKNLQNISCGENVYQNAAVAKAENGIDYEILSRNKELEYADYLNLSAVVRILGEFFDVNSAAAANEASICSVALGTSVEDAFEKAIDCDPISVFGSTIGFSKEVSSEVAKQLPSMHIKNVLAPAFSKEAFSYLLETDINIIKINTPLHEVVGFDAKDIKVTPFGVLVQEQNKSMLSKDSFNVVTQIKPSQEQAEDAIFAWKIAKHLKSRAAVVAKDLSTKAIVQGKTNMVTAVERAMDLACEYSKDAVLALDGVIENPRTLNAAIQGRIGLIIEAGDGKNSRDILNFADKYGLSMIFTKIRNNKY